jgi:hypothetical protein
LDIDPALFAREPQVLTSQRKNLATLSVATGFFFVDKRSEKSDLILDISGVIKLPDSLYYEMR